MENYWYSLNCIRSATAALELSCHCQSYLQGLCVPSLQQKSHLTGTLYTTHISFFTWDSTHFRTSSRLRLEPRDCLRPFSSLKLGEYLLSSFVLPVLVACITPATTNHTPSVRQPVVRPSVRQSSLPLPSLQASKQSINSMSDWKVNTYSLSRAKGYFYAKSRLRLSANLGLR